MARTKHWHAMNGSSGCLPDNNQVCATKREAIAYLRELFPGYTGMATALRDTGIFYFANPAEAGADYAQVCECDEPECLQD